MARTRSFDPRRLDIAAFADDGGALEGELAQAAFGRLSTSLLALPGDVTPSAVPWQAEGEKRRAAGATPELWLHLRAQTTVTLECQRCLQPMTEALALDRWFRFAADEDEAARLDEASEEDVLVASRAFDLQELLEDELILALPLVPRHAVCPEPLPQLAADEGDAAAPNPFAALAALRRSD